MTFSKFISFHIHHYDPDIKHFQNPENISHAHLQLILTTTLSPKQHWSAISTHLPL